MVPMSEPRTQPTSLQSTNIGHVDWLSVAPWTLLFRVPGIVFGKPLLIGIVGSLLLGGWPTTFCELIQTDLASAWQTDGGFESLALGELIYQGPFAWVASLLWLSVWLMLGSAIIDHAARSLCGLSETSMGRSLNLIPSRFLTTLGGLSLTLGGVVLLTGILWLISWLGSFEFLQPVYQTAWPLLTILFGLPLLLITVGLVVGWPLMLCAAVIDKSDTFDATSRTFAYLYQRVFHLVYLILIAGAIGVVCHWILEALQTGLFFTMEPFDQTADITWGKRVLGNFLEGFYFAYFFTASAAIYLLLRKRVDDQPMDDMAV